ncbi:hypothetical protein Pst134EA_002592 [Puccinia striiformis f. sp. tritici]|uniref:hypothetical protein n=1 Tax=Puccinia striiformis f. sp. tritici TaxID=168172 RepID=UPI00200774E8|nr:hypothetical protein Pst134EA_002592 [Puccinia striiformis f. sp. tritici]KAH9471963.1 hypothetical protein Pst134EA_002592 [Puccinia striiformis f. sp. tritici]
MRKDRNQIQQAIDLVVKVLPLFLKVSIQFFTFHSLYLLPTDMYTHFPAGTSDPKLAKKPTAPHENVAMKDEEATSTSDLRNLKPPPMNKNSGRSGLQLIIANQRIKQGSCYHIELNSAINLPQKGRLAFQCTLTSTLLEVYGASVSSTTRLKALVAALKIAYFSKAEYLT